MDRRSFLRGCLGVAGTALAGCVGSSDAPSDANDPDGQTPGTSTTPRSGQSTTLPGIPTGTATPTPTTTATPTVSDSSIATGSTGCNAGSSGTATVGFDASTGTVSVDGTLWASTPCHLASLERVDYDADEDTLRVVVRPVADPDADVCIECVGAVEYTASVEFDGSLPGSVTVVHLRGQRPVTVASVSR